MATAQDIIKRARRLHGSIGRGETPTNAENVDDLAALNAFMDTLWLQSPAVYRIQEDSVSVTAQTHTIGATGDFVQTRPVAIESAAQRLAGTDYPIRILNQSQYRKIAEKTTTSTVITDLFYDPTMPDGTLYFFPVASAATVLLRSRARIETFTINETVILPPGYEDMLAFNMSVILAPEYQRDVPREVAIKANSTLKNIKRLNRPIPQANTGVSSGPRYSIYADV